MYVYVKINLKKKEKKKKKIINKKKKKKKEMHVQKMFVICFVLQILKEICCRLAIRRCYA